MMTNLRTKVIIAALTVTLLTVGLPFQSAFADELDDVANNETSTEIESTAIESSVVSEEEISVSEDAVAPLAAGDVFNDGTWEYTVIAETSATEGTAKVTGYIGTNTSAHFYSTAVHNGITYTVSEIDLGVNGTTDNRSLITDLQCVTVSAFAVDVSGCTALEGLFLAFVEISSLDVSNNLSLRELGCIESNLTSIDVSMLPMLEALYLDRNNISAVDITQNPKLVNLSVGHNNLTDLDLSQNPLLDYLDVSNNKLLNVRGLSALNLTTFEGYDQRVACTMTDSDMGTFVSMQTGLLDPSSVFAGPVGFTYDSTSLLFRALAGSTFPTTGSFTTTQGAYTLEGDITFEYVPAPISTPSTGTPSTATPAAAGNTDGLAKTGDWGLAGIAILLGVSILGLTVMGFGRITRKAKN